MLLLGRRRLLFPVLSGCVLILLLVNPALGASDSLEDLNLSYRTAQPLEVNFRAHFDFHYCIYLYKGHLNV
jgi:hypothetical protein